MEIELIVAGAGNATKLAVPALFFAHLLDVASLIGSLFVRRELPVGFGIPAMTFIVAFEVALTLHSVVLCIVQLLRFLEPLRSHFSKFQDLLGCEIEMTRDQVS